MYAVLQTIFNKDATGQVFCQHNIQHPGTDRETFSVTSHREQGYFNMDGGQT